MAWTLKSQITYFKSIYSGCHPQPFLAEVFLSSSSELWKRKVQSFLCCFKTHISVKLGIFFLIFVLNNFFQKIALFFLTLFSVGIENIWIATVCREILVMEGSFSACSPSLFLRANILHSSIVFSNSSWKWPHDTERDKYLVFPLMDEWRWWKIEIQIISSKRNPKPWRNFLELHRETFLKRGELVKKMPHGGGRKATSIELLLKQHAAPLSHGKMLLLDKIRIWLDIAFTG